MYISRAIEKTILETSATFPVLLITGPRQVGKTTTLIQISDAILKRLAGRDLRLEKEV